LLNDEVRLYEILGSLDSCGSILFVVEQPGHDPALVVAVA
jgi:hypothetical protein